jgi:hypothetical protein
MTVIPFELNEDINLIIVLGKIDDYEVRLALDTGASDTVIDFTALMIAGYHKQNAVANVELETGKGNVFADLFEVNTFEVLGISRKSFRLCSYDFLANSVLTDIDGVLGIDFLMGKKVCIDFLKFEITIQ